MRKAGEWGQREREMVEGRKRRRERERQTDRDRLKDRQINKRDRTILLLLLLVVYLIFVASDLVLLMLPLIQTSRHKTAALKVVFSQLSYFHNYQTSTFNKFDEKPSEKLPCLG